MSFEIENGVLKKYTEEEGVTEITIPDDVSEIGINAFRYYSNIKSVIIPDSVNIIGFGAFNGCTDLRYITIPESVSEIKHFAFSRCTSLESINIPENITSINEYAFNRCTNLEKITFPKNLTKIEMFAFDGTKWLENYPDDFVIINNILYRYKGTEKNIIIPPNVIEIVENAFGYYDDKNSFHRVRDIKTMIFRNCLLDMTVTSGKDDQVFYEIIDMLCHDNFGIYTDRSAKYNIICDLFLADYDNKNFKAYFKKNFTKIFKYAIENDRNDIIKKVINDSVLLTKRNIEGLISHATENNKSQTVKMLKAYQNEHSLK